MSKENYALIQKAILMSDNWTKLSAVHQKIVAEELELTGEEYWDLIIEAWSLAEHNSTGSNLEMWVEVFSTAPEPAPKKHLTGIPTGKFKIYRGGEAHGLSWSLDKDKAVFFQKRKLEFNPMHNPMPRPKLGPLSEKQVTREDVLFTYDGREEKEVVLVPDEAINYMGTQAFKAECKAFEKTLEDITNLERQMDDAVIENLKKGLDSDEEGLLLKLKTLIKMNQDNKVYLTNKLQELYDTYKDNKPIP